MLLVLISVSPLPKDLQGVKIWCILVKRTKTTLRCRANMTNTSTYLLYLFLSSIYTLYRLVIKHIFWIYNHSFDNYWYPKKNSFSLCNSSNMWKLCLVIVVHYESHISQNTEQLLRWKTIPSPHSSFLPSIIRMKNNLRRLILFGVFPPSSSLHNY